MDEINCKIIVSNSHVFASKQVNILVTNLKKMSISEEVSNHEGMSNSDTQTRNVEVQIIPLCIQYQTEGKSDWKPNIGQFM